MTEADLSRVDDGGPLRILNNGLTIIRRKKHQFDPRIAELPPVQIRLRSGKVYGSKFAESWSLQRVTNWIEDRVNQVAWRLTPGQRQSYDQPTDEVVGWVDGSEVHTIRVVSDGRYVHAHPIRDAS